MQCGLDNVTAVRLKYKLNNSKVIFYTAAMQNQQQIQGTILAGRSNQFHTVIVQSL